MIKPTIFLKTSFSLVILGIFLIVIFIALNYQQLSIESYLILSLLLIFTFLFSFVITKRFVLPVEKIIRRATELSKGSLKTRIYLETKDEFEELAKVFNQIAEELERSHSMVEKAKDTVSIKVRARTKELEENIKVLERKVKNRARDLQKMIDEFEKFQQLVAGKESEIIKLKKETKELKEELKKYKNEEVKGKTGRKKK